MDKEVKKAIKLLSSQWLHDEEINYGCTFDVDDPRKIPTDKLRRSAYKALRILKDSIKTPKG